MLSSTLLPAYASAPSCSFFFFNDTATTEIYTLSLHDALPISRRFDPARGDFDIARDDRALDVLHGEAARRQRVGLHPRSEEHTSELQSLAYLVCRLLLEKKKLSNCPVAV